MSLRIRPQREFAPHRLSVMVVDDHDYARTILWEVLRGVGVRRMMGVSSGPEALDALPAFQPDVLITDWDMNAMDGSELARTIRNGMKDFRELPIIMMSGYTNSSHINSARSAGIDEYVTKPLSADKIISRLREVSIRPRKFVASPMFQGPCRRRQNPNYKGVLRRKADGAKYLETDPEFFAAQKQVVLDCTSEAHAAATDLVPGDRPTVRTIFDLAKEAMDAAEHSTDFFLIRATNSLVRYIENTGATERLQADVIATHLDAIQKLSSLPRNAVTQRDALAVGLEMVVDKKLRAAA